MQASENQGDGIVPISETALTTHTSEAASASYLVLRPSQRLADAQCLATAAALGLVGLLVALLTLLGSLPLVAALLALVALMLIAAVAILGFTRGQRVTCLEIMPGIVRHTSGAFRHREGVVNYDAIVSAVVVQGPLQRFLSRTATLELTLACGSGLLHIRVSGLKDATAQRESLLAIGEVRSLDRPEREHLSLARQTLEILQGAFEELSRLRERLDRL